MPPSLRLVPDGPAARMVARGRAAVRRAGARFGIIEAPETFEGGAVAAGMPVAPEANLAVSMEAFAAFPWVFACAAAKAEDLASLPLRVVRGKGRNAERVDTHPVLDLLENPTRGANGLIARQQRVIDHQLAGGAWDLILWYGRQPRGLRRFHPEHTQARVDLAGTPDAWIYSGAAAPDTYSARTVLHYGRPSWEGDERSVFGTGAIRALHADLTSEGALAKRATLAAAAGRPTGLLQPRARGPGDATPSLNPAQKTALIESVDKIFKQRSGGVAFLDAGLELIQLGWNPKDLEIVGLRGLTREAVLAVFGVPPTRVQLPEANYATADIGMAQYWRNLISLAATFDAQYTRLARAFPDSDDLRVEHDFSAVPALQADRTARLDRVQKHVALGMRPADAYAYEGFDDAPIYEVEPAAPDEPPPADDATEADPDALPDGDPDAPTDPDGEPVPPEEEPA